MTWQPSPVLYPDVELELTTAMRPLLGGVFVGRAVPNPRRPRMVTFTRDGGAASDFRDVARVRCLVWDSTDQAATDLARLVVASMPLLVDGVTFLATAHLSGPYEVPDASKQPCRYLLFDVTTRGTT